MPVIARVTLDEAASAQKPCSPRRSFQGWPKLTDSGTVLRKALRVARLRRGLVATDARFAPNAAARPVTARCARQNRVISRRTLSMNLVTDGACRFCNP